MLKEHILNNGFKIDYTNKNYTKFVEIKQKNYTSIYLFSDNQMINILSASTNFENIHIVLKFNGICKTIEELDHALKTI